MKKRRFIVTPRWYSYGGMFESLFTALNLAKYYDRKIIITYPEVHLDKRNKYPGFLNKELKSFKCDDLEVVNRSIISKLLTMWLNINRRIRYTLIGKILTILHLKDKLFPSWVGYSGLETSKGLQKKIGTKEEIPWGKVFKKPVKVELTNDQGDKARSLIDDIGISDEKPFVCIYVRDTGFDELRTARGSNIANSNIANFGKAIYEIIKKGFYVIRIGDPSMVRFNIHKNFIDYIHTPVYCELLDLYFYSKCAFWLGTTGGGRYTAVLYNRPSIVVNDIEIPFSGVCVNKNDVLIRKHIFSVKEKRFLSLKEQLIRLDKLPPADWNFNDYHYVENTPEEISQVVTEWLTSKSTVNFDWNEELQEEYNKLKGKRVREVFFNSCKKEWNNVTVELYQQLKPYIGKKFLEDTWEYGDYLEKLSTYYRRRI